MPIKTSQNLTPRQLQAADLLARGVSITDTAQEVGVRRETVGIWKRQPEFQAAIQEQLTGLRESARARLQTLIEPALEALEGDLRDPSVSRTVRQKAAIAVLDRAGFGPAQAVELSGGGEVKLEVLSYEQRVKLLDELMGGEGPEDTTCMDTGRHGG